MAFVSTVGARTPCRRRRSPRSRRPRRPTRRSRRRAARSFCAIAPAATRPSGLARARAAAAGDGADAVLRVVGVVGVARAGKRGRSRRSPGSRASCVADEHRDRGAERQPVEDARQDLDVVVLLALADEPALAGPPAIELGAARRPRASGSRGGQPSMTTPRPGPCDSPNVVTRNSSPKLDPIASEYRCASG